MALFFAVFLSGSKNLGQFSTLLCEENLTVKITLKRLFFRHSWIICFSFTNICRCMHWTAVYVKSNFVQIYAFQFFGIFQNNTIKTNVSMCSHIHNLFQNLNLWTICKSSIKLIFLNFTNTRSFLLRLGFSIYNFAMSQFRCVCVSESVCLEFTCEHQLSSFILWNTFI